MCGRFVNLRKLPEWRSAYPIDRVDESFTEAASFNVAPSQAVPAIVRLDGQNVLKRLQWGLVPFWARDAAIGSRLINARAETVTVKPAFRNAFRKRRCLILADGFYEWKALEGHKQPMFITPADGSPLAFAGVWEAWDRQGRSDTAMLSCAILTTDASPSLPAIHDRHQR
jgi:putative SOS response-associated peptidase YedK